MFPPHKKNTGQPPNGNPVFAIQLQPGGLLKIRGFPSLSRNKFGKIGRLSTTPGFFSDLDFALYHLLCLIIPTPATTPRQPM
jgi:hypothetical protein